MSSRTTSRVFAGVFAATLVLVGCGQAPADTEVPAVEAPPPSQRWEVMSSDEGSALVLLGEGNTQIFHLACMASPAQIQVIASDFTVIGSEERLTLGVADEAFGFVADTERPGPGMLATGAIDASFLEHMARTTDISAVYGAQQIGPWPAPSPEQRAAFTAACSQIGTPPQTEPTAGN